MRAALIFPFAGLIFLAGYITARYSIVNRVIDSASLLIIELGQVLFRSYLVLAVLGLSILFLVILAPLERIAEQESALVCHLHCFAYCRIIKVLVREPQLENSCGEEGVFNMSSLSLRRVFWPVNSAKGRNTPGWVIGWMNSENDYFVFAILNEESVSIDPSRSTSSPVLLSSRHLALFTYDLYDSRPLEVIGALTYEKKVPSNPRIPPQVRFKLQAEISSLTSIPVFTFLDAAKVETQVILFTPPNPHSMQFFSLTPITLDLTASDPQSGRRRADSVIVDERDETETARVEILVKKMSLHFPRREGQPIQGSEVLITSIDQINSSWELRDLLQRDNQQRYPQPRKRAFSVSDLVREQATNISHSVLTHARLALKRFWTTVSPYIWRLLVVFIIFGRCFSEIIFWIFERRLRPGWLTIKDLSVTARQIDLRLQQISYWPIQYVTLQKRRQDWASITVNHPDYIRFYNSLWLVANDIIMGVAFGTYLIENSEEVAKLITWVGKTCMVEGLGRMIAWLRGWPAGLKLNNELAAFLAELFTYLIDFWAEYVIAVQPYFPLIITVVGYSGFVGMSLSISLLSDILSLLTIHISSFYIASARIYNWQLSILISLFHLFRGKKRNVLRNRIDSCDYDLDQLLLGTIMFTLLGFLFPTVAVFYIAFATARASILVGKVILDIELACLNHWPLFALMLRVKDPARIPGGVRFELYQPPFKTNNASYIFINNVPLPFTAIFSSYERVFTRLRQHYLVSDVLVKLLTGKPIREIPSRKLYSIQFGMLPKRRKKIMEVWAILMGNSGSSI